MLKSKKLKKLLSIIMASVFCMVAFSQSLYAADPEYALKGTIDSALEIMEGATEWESSVNAGQIDIKLRSDAGDGAIFTAYKLLDIKNENGMLKVSIPENAKDFWNKYTGEASATVENIKSALTGDAATQSGAIISKFIEYINAPTGTIPDTRTSTPSAAGQAKITTEFGFYAILQTGAPVNGYIASAPVLACLPMQNTTGDKWLSQFTIVPKDDTISITKQVKATGDADFKDETITNIDDTVTYEIVAELPEYGADIVNDGIIYTLTDTLPAGVTFVDSSIEVTVKEKGGAYSTKTFATASHTSGTITANITDYATNINGKYDEIKITYKAVLNKDAVIEGLGNVNTATLTYSSKVDETATATAYAKVYTLGLDIKKVDADNTTIALTGAEFEVYKDDTGTGDPIKFVDITGGGDIQRYRVATQAEIAGGTPTTTTIKVTESVAKKGMLMIDGLNDTKYYLKETKAPTGYNLPKDLFEIEVKPTDPDDYNATGTELAFDGNRLSKEIKNSTGIDLPVTGGIGTVIFTVVGLLLMAGAAYFLLFSRKRSTK